MIFANKIPTSTVEVKTLVIFSLIAGSQFMDSKPRLESSEFNPVDGLSHNAPNAAKGM